MRNIDQHSELLHLGDHTASEIRKSAMAFVVVTIDPAGSCTPRKRNRSHPKAVERTQNAEIFVNTTPTLYRDQHCDFAFRLRLNNVIGV